MKKLLTLLIFMLSAIVMQAASYDIYIKDIQITDDNKNDVLGDGGSVKFQSSNYLLIFNKANIEYSGKVISIGSNVTRSVQMKFYGTNTFTSKGKHAITHSGTGLLTLWSDEYSQGKLIVNVNKSGYLGIDILGGANLYISRLEMTVNSVGIGIGTHNTPQNETLTIDKSTVNVTGSTSALKIKNIILTDCQYASKYGISEFNSTGYGMRDGAVATEVKINMDVYGIVVGGMQVNARNAHNVLYSDEKNCNKVSFDPANNELTLKGVDITTSYNNAISISNDCKSSDKTFKIKLVGSNKITHTGGSCAIFINPQQVDSALVYSTDGTGSLTVTNSSTSGPILSPINTTFKNCTVNLKATKSNAPALTGYDSKQTAFTFINANVNAESADACAISHVYGLNYHGCFMDTPADSYLDLTTHQFNNESKVFNVVAGTDNVSPFFPFGSTLTAEEKTATSVKINFPIAYDNLTFWRNIKYHVYVRTKTLSLLVKSYDLDIDVNTVYLTKVIPDLSPGTAYKIRLEAKDEAGNSKYYDDLVITTPEATKGDVNLDGKVNVDDVNTLSDKLLGKSVSKFNKKAADMDNNGEISIVDAAQLVEYLKTYHDYVDLGLSVKWATCNIGASKPEEGGLYFAWGDTKGYTSDTSDGHSFDWSTAPFNGGNSDYSSSAWEAAKSSAVDANNNLLPANDAATANWGGTWRMPTKSEQEELRKNCYWEWTSSYKGTNVRGYIVFKVKSDSDKGKTKTSSSSTTTEGTYSVSDTHIFMPVVGKRNYTVIFSSGYGYYWSSSHTDYSGDASYIFFNWDMVNWGSNYCFNGQCVRAVCP